MGVARTQCECLLPAFPSYGIATAAPGPLSGGPDIVDLHAITVAPPQSEDLAPRSGTDSAPVQVWHAQVHSAVTRPPHSRRPSHLTVAPAPQVRGQLPPDDGFAGRERAVPLTTLPRRPTSVVAVRSRPQRDGLVDSPRNAARFPKPWATPGKPARLPQRHKAASWRQAQAAARGWCRQRAADGRRGARGRTVFGRARAMWACAPDSWPPGDNAAGVRRMWRTATPDARRRDKEVCRLARTATPLPFEPARPCAASAHTALRWLHDIGAASLGAARPVSRPGTRRTRSTGANAL